MGLKLVNHEMKLDAQLTEPPRYPLLVVFFNVLFLREIETQCEWGRGRERGRHRIRSRL